MFFQCFFYDFNIKNKKKLKIILIYFQAKDLSEIFNFLEKINLIII